MVHGEQRYLAFSRIGPADEEDAVGVSDIFYLLDDCLDDLYSCCIEGGRAAESDTYDNHVEMQEEVEVEGDEDEDEGEGEGEGEDRDEERNTGATEEDSGNSSSKSTGSTHSDSPFL